MCHLDVYCWHWPDSVQYLRSATLPRATSWWWNTPDHMDWKSDNFRKSCRKCPTLKLMMPFHNFSSRRSDQPLRNKGWKASPFIYACIAIHLHHRRCNVPLGSPGAQHGIAINAELTIIYWRLISSHLRYHQNVLHPNTNRTSILVVNWSMGTNHMTSKTQLANV